MEKKILKKYIFEGFLYPIELKNVEFVKLRGEWMPRIPIYEIAREEIKKMPFQETRLIGHQIKLLRDYLGFSFREFAEKIVKQSHTAVSKWEAFGNKPTNMDPNIEIVLRLYIFHEFCTQTLKQKQAFYKGYEKISALSLSKK